MAQTACATEIYGLHLLWWKNIPLPARNNTSPIQDGKLELAGSIDPAPSAQDGENLTLNSNHSSMPSGSVDTDEDQMDPSLYARRKLKSMIGSKGTLKATQKFTDQQIIDIINWAEVSNISVQKIERILKYSAKQLTMFVYTANQKFCTVGNCNHVSATCYAVLATPSARTAGVIGLNQQESQGSKNSRKRLAREQAQLIEASLQGVETEEPQPSPQQQKSQLNMRPANQEPNLSPQNQNITVIEPQPWRSQPERPLPSFATFPGRMPQKSPPPNPPNTFLDSVIITPRTRRNSLSPVRRGSSASLNSPNTRNGQKHMSEEKSSSSNTSRSQSSGSRAWEEKPPTGQWQSQQANQNRERKLSESSVSTAMLWPSRAKLRLPDLTNPTAVTRVDMAVQATKDAAMFTKSEPTQTEQVTTSTVETQVAMQPRVIVEPPPQVYQKTALGCALVGVGMLLDQLRSFVMFRTTRLIINTPLQISLSIGKAIAKQFGLTKLGITLETTTVKVDRFCVGPAISPQLAGFVRRELLLAKWYKILPIKYLKPKPAGWPQQGLIPAIISSFRRLIYSTYPRPVSVGNILIGATFLWIAWRVVDMGAAPRKSTGPTAPDAIVEELAGYLERESLLTTRSPAVVQNLKAKSIAWLQEHHPNLPIPYHASAIREAMERVVVPSVGEMQIQEVMTSARSVIWKVRNWLVTGQSSLMRPLCWIFNLPK